MKVLEKQSQGGFLWWALHRPGKRKDWGPWEEGGARQGPMSQVSLIPAGLHSCSVPSTMGVGDGRWERAPQPPRAQRKPPCLEQRASYIPELVPSCPTQMDHNSLPVPQGPSSPGHTLTKVTLTHTWREQRGIILGVTPGGRCQACAELGEWKPVPAALPTWDLTSPMVGTVSDFRVPEHRTGMQHLPVWDTLVPQRWALKAGVALAFCALSRWQSVWCTGATDEEQ